MTSITEFKQAFKNPARSNKFEVMMGFPIGVAGLDALRDFPLLCKAAQLPTSQLGTIEVPFQGRVVKIVGDRTFEEWTITILNDENFKIRDAFERWSNAINSHEGNEQLIDNPYGTATVSQLSRNGSIVKTYRFVNVVPTIIAAIELDMASNDQIQEFQVTLTYDYWETFETS